MKTIIEFFRTIYANKKAFIGMLILVFFILMATVGPHLYKLDMTVHFENRFAPPSFQHLLGTDYEGRDTWTLLVYGAQSVIAVAFWTAVITTVVGTVVGATAAIGGKIVDQVIMAIINVVLTIPGFSLNLILASIFAIQNSVSFGLLLSVTAWAPLALAVRAQMLSIRERDYITVAKLMGVRKFNIIFKEIAPNVASFLSIHFIGTAGGAIQASVGIMLLGLAPYSPTNWGAMLGMAVTGTGGIVNPRAMFYFLSPMVAMFLFSLGCFYFSNGIDDFFNPRLRRQ